MARNRSFVIETVFRAVDRLTRPMDNATRRQIHNAGAIDRAFDRLGDNMRRGFTRMASGLGRFTRLAVNAGKQIGGIGLGFAKWGTGAALGLGAGVTLLNHSTTNAERMAKAMQLNVDTVEAFAGALNGTEFNMQNLIDLAEEMTNKIGESKKTGLTEALKGGLKTIGLKYKDIKNLAPEQQFTKFFDVALRMKDKQAAASGLDQIMSGEANKIFGVLASRGVKSIGELTKAYKASNFQTEESRKGAREFTDELAGLVTMLETVAKFAAGILGDRIASKFGDLQGYLESNRAGIQKWITETVDYFVEKLPLAFEKFKELVDYFVEQAPTFLKYLKATSQFFEDIGGFANTMSKLWTTAKLIAAPTQALPALFDSGAMRSLFGDPAAPSTTAPMDANPLGYIQGPQERLQRSIQENNTTSKMQIELNNKSNTVATVKGRAPDGFRMMQTGSFA